MKSSQDFKPYISPDKAPPEFTLRAIISGVILALVFGTANAYLGLRVGLTVSASIPAAVIAMGVSKIFFKNNSILESNMIQTIGSAGESVAAGAIFTLPALFLWSREGIIAEPTILSITLICFLASVLGVLFMIPLRKIILENPDEQLPFPEGTACAKVLISGEGKTEGSKKVFLGLIISSVFKFITDGFKFISGTLTVPFKKLNTQFSTQIYPALLGVGYICGLKIASILLAGGLLSWFVFIPLISMFGQNTILFPASITVKEILETQGPSGIWSNYIRYIGAGALSTAGIISLIKSIPSIVKTFSSLTESFSKTKGPSIKRTSQDLSFKFIIGGILIAALFIIILPQIKAGIISTLIILVFGFFFATVSAKLVGIVGSSNNPVSGMSIATLIIAATIIRLTGTSGKTAMIMILTITSFVCIIVANADDMSQDLKTGQLLGATPKYQQIGEIIGGSCTALFIGGILLLLNKAWGFGSPELAAPQATLMKIVTEGLVNGSLPWGLVFAGVVISIITELIGIPPLVFAIGVYLPLDTNAAIFIGGLIKYFSDRKKNTDDSESSTGVLFCSGLVAGEGLTGVLIAILTIAGIAAKIDFSSRITEPVKIAGGIIALSLLIFSIWKNSIDAKQKIKA